MGHVDIFNPPITVVSRTAMASLNSIANPICYLTEAGREGVFEWTGSDLSAKMVVADFTSVSVSSGADTISARIVTTTSVDSGTDTFTANNHGFSEDENIWPSATVDGVVANADYYAFNVTTNTFQVRTSLSAVTAVDLTGTTNLTWSGFHNLNTGNAVIATTSVDGLTSNTLYYVIRTSAAVLQLATTPLLAIAGTALDLTGTTNLTLRHIADPLQNMFVVAAGASQTGSAGAWVRQSSSVVNCCYSGASLTSADNWYALQASVWLGYYLGLPTYLPGGNGAYLSSNSIRHFTHGRLVTVVQGDGPLYPDNGIVFYGDGPELSVIRASSTFPATTYLLHLDGNQNGVAELVGSMLPYAQGTNQISNLGFQGRGSATGTACKGFGFRACWGLWVTGVEFIAFSGETIEHLSAVAAASAKDDVDASANVYFERFRAFNGGANCIRSTQARLSHFHMRNFEIQYFVGCGVLTGSINSSYRDGILASCGARAVTTTGGIRLAHANSATATAALCRDNLIENVTFEANVNYEINVAAALNTTVIGGAYNLYEPSGGAIANKAALRIGTSARHVTVIGGYFADYSLSADAWYFDLTSGALDVSVSSPTFVHTTSQVRLQTAVRFMLNEVDGSTISYTITGSTPVDSYINQTPIGTLSAFNVEGFTTVTTDNVLSDVNTAQNIFASASDEITLVSGKAYAFTLRLYVSRTAGTTSHTVATLFGGTATFTSFDYIAEVSNPTGLALAAAQLFWGTAATATTLTAANIIATENLLIRLEGIIRVGASGGGTLIPQIQYSAAPGGAPTVKRGTTFEFREIGVTALASNGPVS